MKKSHLLASAALFAAAAVFCPSSVLAQTAEPAVAAPAVEDPNTGGITFGANLNFTTSYFFRGYNQEDTGLIFQPDVFATVSLVDSDDFDLTGTVGLWNSLHSEQTASDGIWYESDLYANLVATFGNFYGRAGYTLYTYPDDAFESIQEVGFAVGFNDAYLWESSVGGGFSLAPEVGVYFETDDGNGTEDTYLEFKLTPSYTFDRSDLPVIGKATISLPIVLGTSVDDYYLDSDGDDTFFGYVQAGVAVKIPLEAIPAKYGAWYLTGGVNYIHMLADSTELANDGGTDYEVQGMVGLSMSY